MARPWRLVASLLVLPAVAALVARRRWAGLASFGGACVLVAEAGRRRAGGRRVFPASSTALAPVWVLWRSVCTALAIGSWFRGGVRYRDTRLRRAATPLPTLRRRLASTADRPGSRSDLASDGAVRAPGDGAADPIASGATGPDIGRAHRRTARDLVAGLGDGDAGADRDHLVAAVTEALEPAPPVDRAGLRVPAGTT
jgi:hypothetical protein